jgi:hypothetical protein
MRRALAAAALTAAAVMAGLWAGDVSAQAVTHTPCRAASQ